MEPVGEEDLSDPRKRKALYLGQARELTEGYEALLKDPRWKPVSYSGDKHIACYELDAGVDEGYNLKAECIIEGKNADTIAEAHRNYQVIPRKQWDSADIYDIGCLEKIREMDISTTVRFELNVQFAEHKPVLPGISIREFVYIEASLREVSEANRDDHKWVILTRDTSHPNRPVRDDPVRALARTTMILTPLPPKNEDGILIPQTSVTLVFSKVAPGGNVPDGAIKLYKTKPADRLAFLKKTMFI